MQARSSSGVSEDDLLATKIYMRTLADALSCANDIAEREAAKKHYKEYVKTLIDSMKAAPMIVDKEGSVISATNSRSLMVYKLMSFSKQIVSRYGL
mmetsp:Transcript_19851/g.24542  ORF Transcript_19851/g.24542 Transcript_19851/m.24542 type:complete len:96 (-) Transcript_19851:264-551(-)